MTFSTSVPTEPARPAHVQWLLALGGWTVLIWFQRINNVIDDAALHGFAQTWRLVVAVGFVVAGAGLVGSVVAQHRGFGIGRFASPLGVRLAVVGSAWWILRSVQILIGDWDPGFKMVHTALAVVVVGLSVMVWRSRGYDRALYG